MTIGAISRTPVRPGVRYFGPDRKKGCQAVPGDDGQG